MYYFNELSLIPDESISTGFVLSKVMDVLHLCFVNLQKELGHNPVGLSFPKYSYDPEAQGESKGSLGSQIRLYAQTEAHLEALNLKQQLRRFEDYVHLRAVRELDRANLGFVCFKREHVKSSVERLAKRRAANLEQSLEEARAFFKTQGKEDALSDLPYVHLHSQSSEQVFRLFISKHVVETPTEWMFSTYGLSAKIGVPDV